VIRVQQGNTSQPVADKFVAEHQAARVRVYAYDEIERALDDFSSGRLRCVHETRAGHRVARA
jgi:hypothetical protein